MNNSELNFNPKAVCKYCTELIFNNGNVMIRCQECPDLELCPDCFANKAELGDHKPDHSYRLIDNAGYPVLRSNWTAKDHVKLLDAIEQYGYGNWEDISRYISTRCSSGTKTPADTKMEFCSTFVDASIGQITWKEDVRGNATDHTQSNNPLTPSSAANEPPSNLTLHESIMLGYMPKRDDYEIEYDNYAEKLVSQLQGAAEEDELDLALKIAHVDMYKFKLRERERRRRITREHDLISQFFKDNPINADSASISSAINAVTTKKEKTGSGGSSKGRKQKNGGSDFLDKLKIFAEFQSAKEHQSFIASMTKERELKQQVKDFQKYRKNGITKLTDSTEFEIQKTRQSRKRSEQRKRNGDSVIKSENLNGGTSPINAMSPAHEQKTNALVDLPGYDILSANEKKLCSSLKLTPAQYISYKTMLLTNHIQKKKGQAPKPLNPIGLDKNNRKIIFNFLMRAGWINAY